MDTLDLDIEEGVEDEFDTVGLLDEVDESLLVVSFDLDEFSLSLWVISDLGVLLKLFHINNPVVAAGELVQPGGEGWVAALQPTTGGHTVCLVLELVWLHVEEVLE